MSAVDAKALQVWVGRQNTAHDELRAFPAQGLAAALERGKSPTAGDPLPPAWQWLYFLDTPLASVTGSDGHPKATALLPPPPLPRRMWAAGGMRIEKPLRLGFPAQRRSTIQSIEAKSGKSGSLVFLHLAHEFLQDGSVCIREEQNLVYREMPAGPAAEAVGEPAPAAADWTREIMPDPVLLFRYSALTYNSHRIHYDRPYATGQEFYADLVVQGPLLATLLLELCQAKLPHAAIRSFEYRAVRPTFVSQPFTVSGSQDGKALSLWSAQQGQLCMSAKATLA